MKRSKSIIGATLAAGLLIGTASSAFAAPSSTSSTPSTSSTAVAAAAVPEVIEDSGARTIDFNEDWKFFLATRTPTVLSNATLELEDVGVTTAEAIDPAFDDSAWRTVQTPHDWSIEGDKVSSSTNSQAYLQGGLGWYRKTFSVPESMQAERKRVTIDFEGVYQNSVVYLNGELVGTTPSGYTGFAYDLTDRLVYGDDAVNTIVVKVQNPAPSGRWYTGSGITLPVNLVVTDPVRFVRHGIDLTTPTLETTYNADGSAQLELEASVFSDATNGIIYTKTSVIEADGTVAATAVGDPVETNPSTLTTLSDTITVPAVDLWYPWNIGDPTLYTVRTELFYLGNGTVETRLVDTVDTSFGFRWFEVADVDLTDPSSGGLYVNDVYTKIQGVDLHHDSGALGAAANKDAFDRQWDKLVSMGVNAFRTAHNPAAKDAIEVASEKGIIVVEEAYDGWGATKATYDFGRFFLQPVPQDWAGLGPNGLLSPPTPAVNYDGAQYLWSDWVIREMVQRDKNEPSVFMWSIGNEVRGVGSRPSWYDPSKYDLAGFGGATAINEYTEAVRLTQGIKAIDPNRLVTMGGDQQRNPPAIDSTWGRVNRFLDGYGLNYNTAISVDRLTERFPGTFFFESESSSQTSSRGVYLDPTIRNTGINLTPGRRGGSNYDNDFASWTMSNEYGLKKDRDRKAFLGQFIWTGFDYLGEPTPYSVYPVGVSSFGAIDTAGFPKDSYHLFRSQWLDPADGAQVHVLPGNWNEWREGEEVEVWVNANAPTVELFLNGESLGRKSFDVKETAYGKQYLETSEAVADDKTWPTSNGNTGGYASTGATIVDASGDSAIPAGTNYGKLHLTWKVPFAEGVLEARAYDSADATEPVAIDTVATASSPYTIELSTNKEVITADGRSLAYIEATVVDEDGNEVPDADNLVQFTVDNGAIVGVDNGQQESTEPYKWDGEQRSTYSQRSAYAGKVLAIVQSDKDAVGQITLTARADGLQPAVVTIAATEDGTGTAPAQPTLAPTLTGIAPVAYAAPVGSVPTLPVDVQVTYADATVGAFGVTREVTWTMPPASSFATPGELVITGTVEGVETPAKAYVSVVTSTASGDIAANPTLGANNQAWNFAALPADSPLRAGALATATFTGAATTYPNNALNGDTASAWSNQYSRGANVLLPAYSASRTHEWFELFWDGERTFDQVQLSFTAEGPNARPSAVTAQYWDGLAWQDVEGLETTFATASNAPTTLDFDSVFTQRIRVGLTNATPYSATGNLRIVSAVVNGESVVGAVVKSGLQAAYDAALLLEEDDFKPESWVVLEAALDQAAAVLADADATSQEVAEATAALAAAVAGLTPIDAATLEALTIVTPPSKTDYVLGESLDLAGLAVTATFSDETVADVPLTALTVTGFDGTTVGTQTITLTYEVEGRQQTATFDVTVRTFFLDVPQGLQFYSEITWLAEKGISTGWVTPQGREYRPLAPIARDAMAAFLYRLAESPEFTAPTVSPFVDVKPTDQFYKEITWLAETKISTGWANADGTASFRPLDPIARDAMAAFLFRLAAVTDYDAPATSPFLDVTTSNQFYDEISWLAENKISTGWVGNDGSADYKPLQPVNRDAMAAFLSRFDALP
ncbi:hypothetical protein C8046_13285 [Serinibacter arcticus]|uniref:SLH domain-containing protein n=1 Tax=Serinibacter arcticus TaxID=1655435 RepID=A0A2U1ZX20_9MICO|nr:sugar-binding domain-containing protein [Serinibacter arcticus]PWD51483.1 hypothetical protein C8046_13285 [Serinibacter arcticus]